MEKTVVLLLFMLTYVMLLSMPKHRAAIASFSAFILISLALFIPEGMEFTTLVTAIDFNVLMMIAGTMMVVVFFIESNAPAACSDWIVKRVANLKWAIISLAFFAGLLSAFVDNVATVLIVAPIALDISKRLHLSPIPMIVAITVSANLQGFATLVGDTTSIMLGSTANMNFADFFWLEGRIGPFFIVQLGAFMTVLVQLVIFRKWNQPISVSQKAQVKDLVPSFLLIGIIVLLIGASFLPSKPKLTNGWITISIAIVAVIYNRVKNGSWQGAKRAINQVDWSTLLLLIGLFIMIAGLSEVGVINDIAHLFVQVGGNHPFVLFSMVVWISVLLSAFIDNIPYVATMLPIMSVLAQSLEVSPYLLYFGLLTGATLGGNLTPIGASANIAGIGILRGAGIEVKFSDFGKIAIPMTLVAVLSAFMLLWLVWA